MFNIKVAKINKLKTLGGEQLQIIPGEADWGIQCK